MDGLRALGEKKGLVRKRPETGVKNMTEHQKRIREKRSCLRQAHGNAGLISAADLAAEIAVRDYRTAQKWAEEVGLCRLRIGQAWMYDLDQLAKILIERME